MFYPTDRFVEKTKALPSSELKRALVVTTPAESKRLIAKAVKALPEVKNALKNGNIVIALGTSIGEEFDIENLRYKKVVIMADADVDGAHIKTLILTLLFRYFRPLIDAGYVYVAQPPLYSVKKGKKMEYAFTDKEKDALIKKMGEGSSLQRYKGLGEMNPDQLWETTMDPENRVLLQVNVDDAEEADRIFDHLMGANIKPRKRFIEIHAKGAGNIDV